MDERAHYALSHLANMTFKQRRQWARVFIGSRQQGLGRLAIILFSIRCARQLGSVEPLLVALRVVPRVEPIRGRAVRSVWHVPSVWAPRAVGALALGIALWGMLAPHPNAIRVDPSPEQPIPEDVAIDWLTRDGGVVAVPMPPKRLERQQAPPCAPPPDGQMELNGGCWSEMRVKPPCGQFYEHEGRCYVPVRETPRPPTSVDP